VRHKLEFGDESLFVDVLDQYMIWRLNDLIEFDVEPKVRRACFVLKAYMEAPQEEEE
jgi:hypothetical protein